MGPKITLCVFLFVFFSMADGTPIDLKVENVCGPTNTAYTFYEYESVQSCYKFHAVPKTWQEARDICQRDGGDLVVVNSKAEAQLLTEIVPFSGVNDFSFRLYIGFSKHTGSWVTVGGESLAEAGYANWAVGEPKYAGGGQKCGAMYSDGKLVNIECNKLLWFVCEKQPGISIQDSSTASDSSGLGSSTSTTEQASVTEPESKCGTTDTAYEFDESLTSCYKFHPIPKTWQEARDICRREGGDLVVVNSKAEAQHLSEGYNWRSPRVFVGFSKHNGSWRTVSGQSLAEAGYEYWAEGEPNNAGEGQECGAMYTTDEDFDDIECDKHHQFFCEKQLDATTTEDTTYDTTTEVWYEPSTSTEAETESESTSDGTLTSESSSQESWPEPASVPEPQHRCGNTDTAYTFYESVQSCYKFHPVPTTWQEARDICKREGGDLVVVNSKAEAQLLTEIVPFSGVNEFSYRLYVGFSKHTGSWVTVGGESLPQAGYANWAVGEPNNAGEGQKCGAMYSDGNLDDIGCNKLLWFVCEKQPGISIQDSSTASESSGLGSSTSTTELASVTEPECGTMDTAYEFDESLTSCYEFHLIPRTWQEARDICQREGGDLVVVNSKAEARFLSRRYNWLSERVFVGFSKHNGSWRTVSGQSLAEAGYENWAEGEPNNAGEGQDCGAMYATDEDFDNIECDNRHPYFCEKQPGTWTSESSSQKSRAEPDHYCGTTDTAYILDESVHSCYKYHSVRKTWQEARDICQHEGGDLVVVNSKAETEMLSQIVPFVRVDRIYLGFSKHTGSWVTVGGESLAEAGYDLWDDGEPNNVGGVQKCGAMYPNGRLDDIECNKLLKFVCEKSPNNPIRLPKV